MRLAGAERRLRAANRMTGKTINIGNMGTNTRTIGVLNIGSSAAAIGFRLKFAVKNRRGRPETKTRIREKPAAEMRTAPASDTVSLLRSRTSGPCGFSPVAMPSIVRRALMPVKLDSLRMFGGKNRMLNAVAPGARLIARPVRPKDRHGSSRQLGFPRQRGRL